MPTLETVDAGFFESAPQLIRSHAHVDAPRRRVFAAVARDPGGWGRWFPGFSDDGRWETPPPDGVGSVRTVAMFGVRYRETIVAWDDDERWAFRLDEVSGPAPFTAFAEEYRFADEGSGTRLSWTVATRPSTLMRISGPLLPAGFGWLLRRAARRLSLVA